MGDVTVPKAIYTYSNTRNSLNIHIHSTRPRFSGIRQLVNLRVRNDDSALISNVR